ncbi:hypothetical protein CDIK_1294, partial [Cucumispora dikerogammari]
MKENQKKEIFSNIKQEDKERCEISRDIHSEVKNEPKTSTLKETTIIGENLTPEIKYDYNPDIKNKSISEAEKDKILEITQGLNQDFEAYQETKVEEKLCGEIQEKTVTSMLEESDIASTDQISDLQALQHIDKKREQMPVVIEEKDVQNIKNLGSFLNNEVSSIETEKTQQQEEETSLIYENTKQIFSITDKSPNTKKTTDFLNASSAEIEKTVYSDMMKESFSSEFEECEFETQQKQDFKGVEDSENNLSEEIINEIKPSHKFETEISQQVEIEKAKNVKEENIAEINNSSICVLTDKIFTATSEKLNVNNKEVKVAEANIKINTQLSEEYHHPESKTESKTENNDNHKTEIKKEMSSEIKECINPNILNDNNYKTKVSVNTEIADKHDIKVSGYQYIELPNDFYAVTNKEHDNVASGKYDTELTQNHNVDMSAEDTGIKHKESLNTEINEGRYSVTKE